MKPHHERLNDRLEQLLSARPGSELTHLPQSAASDDPEIERLVAVAQRLRSAPSLQVDPDFARRLEARMLAHRAVGMRGRLSSGSAWFGAWFQRPLLRTALVLASVVLCMLLLGTGVLMAAGQTNPGSPLYAVKGWAQALQSAFAPTPVTRAETDGKNARDQLNNLKTLADPSNAGAYEQAITTFDQQVATFAQAIQAVPAGTDHQRLAQELVDLKVQARQTLRALLPRLSIPERQVTTDELGRLGDSVPHLNNARIELLMTSNEQAIILLYGSNLQAKAQLLVNGQPVTISGSMKDGTYMFIMGWTGTQAPKTLGLMNPDGTVAQTEEIALTVVPAKNNGDSGTPPATNGANGKNQNATATPAASSTATASPTPAGDNGGNNNGNGGLPTLPPIIPTVTPIPIPTISIKL